MPEAQAAVRALHGFQECIVRRVEWNAVKFTLTVSIEYVWTDDGQICFVVGQSPREVVLRFELVNEVTMFSALNLATLAEPERLNWGAAEIAALEVTESTQDSTNFAHARFVWEGERRIDIEYRILEIIGPVATETGRGSVS